MNKEYNIINYQKVNYFLKTVYPSIPVINTSTMNIKNIVLAIEAAPSAIPVKPNIAATMAIMRKMAVHFSIMKYYFT